MNDRERVEAALKALEAAGYEMRTDGSRLAFAERYAGGKRRLAYLMATHWRSAFGPRGELRRELHLHYAGSGAEVRKALEDAGLIVRYRGYNTSELMGAVIITGSRTDTKALALTPEEEADVEAALKLQPEDFDCHVTGCGNVAVFYCANCGLPTCPDHAEDAGEDVEPDYCAACAMLPARV